jgi:predicted transcriptional regulator
MDIRRVVGKNVRRSRIEARLSQEELAAGMGVEQDYVKRLEAGGVRSHYCSDLARSTGLVCSSGRIVSGGP